MVGVGGQSALHAVPVALGSGATAHGGRLYQSWNVSRAQVCGCATRAQYLKARLTKIQPKCVSASFYLFICSSCGGTAGYVSRGVGEYLQAVTTCHYVTVEQHAERICHLSHTCVMSGVAWDLKRPQISSPCTFILWWFALDWLLKLKLIISQTYLTCCIMNWFVAYATKSCAHLLGSVCVCVW